MLRVCFCPHFLSVSPFPESILFTHPPTLLGRAGNTHRVDPSLVIGIWLHNWPFLLPKRGDSRPEYPTLPFIFQCLLCFLSLSALHSMDLWSLKSNSSLSQWCNRRRLQSIFLELCKQLYCVFRTVWLLCLLNHMKDYKQCYFSETLYSHWN